MASQVCELDIIFNFEKAYFILDEFLLGGEAQETSKKNVLKAIEQADLLQEVHAVLHLQIETDKNVQPKVKFLLKRKFKLQSCLFYYDKNY